MKKVARDEKRPVSFRIFTRRPEENAHLLVAIPEVRS